MTDQALKLKQRFRLARFFRGEKAVNHSLTLNHRRIFILPTLRGLGFVLLIVVILLIAFVYNNNLVYLLGFLLASVFFTTILHSYRSLAGLIIRPGSGKPAFAGEAAGFTFTIENPSSHPRFLLTLSLQSQQQIELPARQQCSSLLYVDSHRRGWLACPTLTVSSTFPLGLFRTWSPLRFALQTLIYPTPASNETAFPDNVGGEGEQGTGPRGGEDFYGLQSYRQGDAIHRIHWKSFAKGQGLFSKEFGGTQSPELWLDLNSTPGQDLDQRISRLCRWIIDAEQNGLTYGIILPDGKIEPGHGQTHQRHCLKSLALL